MSREDFEGLRQLAKANHDALGTTNCGIGGYWPRNGKTWEDGFADMKKFCGMLKEKGLNFTYHNHSTNL